MIKSTGDSISMPVLKDYLEYMEEAYLFFTITNFASSLTEQSSVKKRYVADNGILSLFLFQGETKLLENIVAIDLNRRYRNTEEEQKLYFYNSNYEIDFCVPTEKLAIQVAYNMLDEATYKREIGGLLKFLKAFPDYEGCVVTRDYEETVEVDDKSISIVPVWKWLLK